MQTFVNRLGSAGKERWELVSYQPVPITGAFSHKIKSYAYLMIFKRPIGALASHSVGRSMA